MATEFDKLSRFQAQVDAAGIPNEGVALGPPRRVFYLPAATDQHRQQGQQLIESFNPDDDSAQQVFDVANARRLAKALFASAGAAAEAKFAVVLRASVLALLDLVNQRTPVIQPVTPAQMRAMIIAKIDAGNAD